MIVDINTFNTFSGNYEDSPDALSLKQTFIESATNIVTSYLGYDPLLKDYKDILLSSSGSKRLFLPAMPITKIEKIIVNGCIKDVNSFSFMDDYIYFKDYSSTFAKSYDNILVSFTAGWSLDELPSIISLSVLRIATLMLSETNGNIGLSGKSFADNSRTFINYSNYKKYLEPLDAYKICEF